eukprot:311633-Chlamydomonas_euryale.AAC.16
MQHSIASAQIRALRLGIQMLVGKFEQLHELCHALTPSGRGCRVGLPPGSASSQRPVGATPALRRCRRAGRTKTKQTVSRYRRRRRASGQMLPMHSGMCHTAQTAALRTAQSLRV